MRSKQSIKNVIFGWGMQLVVILSGFIVRTVFIRVLGEEYLGLSGLFSNILTMLSLAELGVGTAIVFSLYKPIAENDREQMIALMGFYRKFYWGVGCFVLVVGSALTPLLPFFIKEMPDIPHLYGIYLLYVLNTGVSYFFSYKSAFVNANQENFLVSVNHGGCYLAMVVIQVVVLLTTRNFIAYYVVQIAATLTENIIISRVADWRYPFLKTKEKYKINRETSRQIKTNTLAMVGHNVGTILVFSTDNLIISKFVGLVEVGLYSNYLMMINSVSNVLQQAFTAITSSVGNLLIMGEEEQKENTFYMIFFANFWMYGFSSIALLCLMNPFIEIWVGTRYWYEMPIVAVLALKVYTTGMRLTCNTFKNAAGLYMQDVYKPYVEVVVNLTISLVLVQRIGILGVFLGTVITTLAVPTWIEPMVLFKYEFGKRPFRYFGKYLKYAAITLVSGGITYYASQLVSLAGIPGFLLRMVVVVLVPNLLFLLASFWTGEFRMLLGTVGKVWKGWRN